MIELSVKDMTCGHCAGAVTRAVKSVDPQANVEVDLESKRVRVDGGKPAEELIRALHAAGYPAVPAVGVQP
ncbi:MAG TPA: heavy-metal-associated domain-containing protein [Burkholderiales bacterium]